MDTKETNGVSHKEEDATNHISSIDPKLITALAGSTDFIELSHKRGLWVNS